MFPAEGLASSLAMRCRLDYRYLIRPREHAPIELLIKRIYKTLAPAASLPVFTQHHLLNPRACSAYLWSEDAACSQDPETQALLLSIHIAACSSRPIQQATRLDTVSDLSSAGAPAAAGSNFHARGSAAPYSVHSVPPSPPTVVVATSIFQAGDSLAPHQPLPHPPSPHTAVVAASIFHDGDSLAPRQPLSLPHPPSPPTADNPEGGQQLGFLQCQLVDSGGAESLLVALNRRCDTLEAQNAVLRTKVLQLYPPGAYMRASSIMQFLVFVKPAALLPKRPGAECMVQTPLTALV